MEMPGDLVKSIPTTQTVPPQVAPNVDRASLRREISIHEVSFIIHHTSELQVKLARIN